MGASLALLWAVLAVSSGERLGVFQLGIVGADPALAQTAIDAIATALSEAGVAVVSRSDLDAMLGAEKLKESVGCDDVACLAEIGAAAGVERVIAGSVSRLEQGWVVSLQLINTKFATVENRVTLDWPSPALETTAVLGAAAELVAIPAAERGPGTLRLGGVPADAAVIVDGAPRGIGLAAIEELAVGVHTFRVEAPGFEPYSGLVAIRRGRPTQHDARLVAAPPFYTRVWFWSATAAVLGGTALAVVLATRGDRGAGTTEETASGIIFVPGLGVAR